MWRRAASSGNALLESSQYVTPLIGLGKHLLCCMQEFATLGRVDERRRVTIVLNLLPSSRDVGEGGGRYREDAGCLPPPFFYGCQLVSMTVAWI
jgi:hypothetical protein